MTDVDTTPKDRITATERRELRAVVRSQMKALRSEVAGRESKLRHEVDKLLAEKYHDENERIRKMKREAAKITEEANMKLRELLTAFEAESIGGSWDYGRREYETPPLRRTITTRQQAEQQMTRAVQSQIRQAQHVIDRQEADLLKELAFDALRTDAAQQFLTKFPTAEELVPAPTLKEIEG